MKILFVSSEVYPFLKTGGLADVAYALPKALRKLGIDARVITPLYEGISDYFKSRMKFLFNFDVHMGEKHKYCGIKYLEHDSVPFYFVDNEEYFKRPGAYGYFDDGERFAFFSKAVLRSIHFLGEEFNPDVIHCNDWQTGILPPILKDHYRFYGNYNHIKTVFTIHNLKYQGVYSPEVLKSCLNLDQGYYSENNLKYYDGVSYMKGGIKFSDKITTVSRTYAEEIKTPQFGEGLHGLLYQRRFDLWGITNGIDYDVYNPETDKDLFFNYNSEKIDKKSWNKTKLQERLHLTVDKNIPMIGIVSRLVPQKGFDLIAYILNELLKSNVQVVCLGTGDRKYEDMFKFFAWKYPDKLSANIYFSSEMAQKIYAASDFFLMPSLFEPCGIGQLIALRYGTLPIVRETGGLNDTVISYNEATGEGNGFSFTNYNADDMLFTIRRAINYYYNNKYTFNMLVKRAMSIDNSWEKSAKKYIELYSSIIQ